MSQAMYGWKMERARTRASRSMVMQSCHGFSGTGCTDDDAERRWAEGIVLVHVLISSRWRLASVYASSEVKIIGGAAELSARAFLPSTLGVDSGPRPN
jgi:hypothetical protein